MRQLKITKQVTNRETASLDKYLQEIGKVDLITADEEVELAQRIKAGDQVALEKLTKANLRFVVSVAKQYQNQGLTLPDLINEGNLGLIKAAQRFDETRGFKFISYAVWWIRQSILQALAEQSRIVRLPLNKIGSINKINKTFAFLEQAHERPPSAEEIAKELDMTINDVKESMKNPGRRRGERRAAALDHSPLPCYGGRNPAAGLRGYLLHRPLPYPRSPGRSNNRQPWAEQRAKHKGACRCLSPSERISTAPGSTRLEVPS